MLHTVSIFLWLREYFFVELLPKGDFEVFPFHLKESKKIFGLNVECLKALHEVFMYLMILMAQKGRIVAVQATQ